MDGLDGDDSDESDSNSQGDSLYREVVDFCGGPDLIEVFGPSGSGKSEFSFKVAQSAIDDEDKDVLIIDTEKNVGSEDELDGADYVYIPDWHDIYQYIVSSAATPTSDAFGENKAKGRELQDGYDMVVLDSIGFPALVQYGEYRIEDNADQFKVFNELQVITGHLKKYAQYNEALVMVTNQPKSDLSGEDEPNPFGDKSIFGFKEIWKTQKVSSNEIKTTCKINSFRSRQTGNGATIWEMEVDDSGTSTEFIGGDEGDKWT